MALSDLDLKLDQKIDQFTPFGIGNPGPVFASRKVKVVDARLVGAENNHLKLQIRHNTSDIIHNAIGFGMGHLYSQLSPEKPIDIAYNLMINEWDGEERLELRLKDIKLLEKTQ